MFPGLREVDVLTCLGSRKETISPVPVVQDDGLSPYMYRTEVRHFEANLLVSSLLVQGTEVHEKCLMIYITEQHVLL